MDEPVVIDRDGAVLTIRLAAPERLNAVTAAMLRTVTQAVLDGDQDDVTRVIVLTGTGRAFCSGADLAAGEPAREPSQVDTSTLDAANELTEVLTSAGTPVVCAMNGLAAGVGASLALACDLVVAHEDAYLLLPFAKIGLIPDGGATQLVAASLGRSRALQLALLGERLPVQEALAAGLVVSVHPGDGFQAAVDALVRRLAQGPTCALGSTKRAINAASISGFADTLHREHEVQTGLLSAPEHREGVAAFTARRRPDFAGAATREGTGRC